MDIMSNSDGLQHTLAEFGATPFKQFIGRAVFGVFRGVTIK